MNWENLLKRIKEIDARIDAGCDLSFLENNIDFSLRVGSYHDYCLNNDKKSEALESYVFFAKYFITYMAKKYNKSFKYDFFSDTKDTFYNPYDNSINISKYNANKDYQMILFILFHEFKHKMQRDDIKASFEKDSLDKILEIDPATIIFLKEQYIMKDYDLYRENHDCFIMEHDANLFSLSECKHFFNTDFTKKLYSGELSNYIKAMVEGIDLTDQQYHDRQALPIIYEQDYQFKKSIAGKHINSGSILGLIYNSDGKPKSYEELMKEKNDLIKKHSGKVVIRYTSSLDHQPIKKTSEEHIEEIYKLIIASDPVLSIEEALYKYNTIKDKNYKKKYLNKIVKLLDDSPKLNTIYFSEIKNLLLTELDKGNEDLVRIVASLSHAFKNLLPEEYDMDKEKIPFSSNAKQSVHRPKISDAVKRIVKLKYERQKLQEKKQQLLSEEYQKKLENLIDQEGLDEEEIQGMSM